jgi:hypothetical protein
VVRRHAFDEDAIGQVIVEQEQRRAGIGVEGGIPLKILDHQVLHILLDVDQGIGAVAIDPGHATVLIPLKNPRFLSGWIFRAITHALSGM